MSRISDSGRNDEPRSARRVVRGLPDSAAPTRGADSKSLSAVQKRREEIKAARKAKGEGMGIFLNCLGIIAGTIVIIFSLGFFAFSYLVGGILGSIRDRDLSKPLNRLQRYEDFFDNLAAEGYDVKQSPVKLLDSEQIYLWRVVPTGTDDGRVFKWKYDLESNSVIPQTNGALILDVKLNYIKPSEAESFSFEGNAESYSPDDSMVRSIIESDASLIEGSELAEGWSDGPQLPGGPVSAPLISPDEAKGRQSRLGGGPSEEEEAAAEGEAGAEAGEAVEVGAETGGEDDGSVEVGGEAGEESGEGGGEQTPPEEGSGEGEGSAEGEGEGSGGTGGGEDPDDATDVW